MTGDIITLDGLDPGRELDQLAHRYRSANRAGVRFLNAMGGQAENLLDQLPETVQSYLGAASEQALHLAVRAADGTRRWVPDQTPWVNTALTTAMGAVGGLGGVPSALAELPVTTTMLLRSIQAAAREEGFDPSEDGVKFDCVRVFSAAGPLEEDDGADLGFVSVRLSLTGPALNGLITSIAPKLSVSLGQKLAARAVPVLGAVAGATSNFIYTRYYQDVARVQFGLRRLAADTGRPREDLVAELRERLQAHPV